MKIYLHIGTHKTGTTSIQAFAAAHSALLLRHGIYWPPSATLKKPSQQHSILWHLLKDGQADKVADFVAEAICRAEKLGAHSMLLSGEGFSQAHEDEIESFLKLLDAHNVQVIVYFRNIYAYARSAFMQHMKYADRRPRLTGIYERIRGNLDYSALLARWQRFLPEGAIEVRAYDDEKQALVPRFFTRLGVCERDICVRRLEADSNLSIEPSLQLLLACLGNDQKGGDFRRTREIFLKTFGGRNIASPLVADMVAILCQGAAEKMVHPLLAPFREQLSLPPPRKPLPSLQEQAAYFASLARFSRRMARRKKFEASSFYPLWRRIKGKVNSGN